MIELTELLSSKDAEEKPGIESSVEKWDRIESVLQSVIISVRSQCGLCAEAGQAPNEDAEIYPYNCRSCALGNCIEEDSLYSQVWRSLKEAFNLSGKLRSELIKLQVKDD